MPTIDPILLSIAVNDVQPAAPFLHVVIFESRQRGAATTFDTWAEFFTSDVIRQVCATNAVILVQLLSRILASTHTPTPRQIH